MLFLQCIKKEADLQRFSVVLDTVKLNVFDDVIIGRGEGGLQPDDV